MNTKDFLYVESEKVSKFKDSFIKKGDILITRTGAKAGATVSVRELSQEFCVSSHSIRVIPNEELANSLYLESFLLSRWGKIQIERLFTGAAQKQLQLNTVGELSIALPPIPKQQRLADEIETARESHQKKLKQAEELLGSLDAWLLETLGLTTPPPNMRKVFAVRLNQLLGHRLDALAHQPFFSKERNTQTQFVPLYKLTLINAHQIDKPEDEGKLVPYIGLPECSQSEIRSVVMRPYREVKGRSVVKQGDILFARIEPSIFNQKYVLAEDLQGHDYAYTSTEFYVVNPIPKLVNLHYLYAMFFCSLVSNQVQGKTTGSSGRRRLDVHSFRNLQIPLPKIEIQRIIAKEMLKRREWARRLRAEAEAEWTAAKARFEAQLLGK